jgi:hypothetical protein
MNCRGCGVELDPSQEQVNTAVDQILETSVKDAEKKGGVCPLLRPLQGGTLLAPQDRAVRPGISLPSGQRRREDRVMGGRLSIHLGTTRFFLYL